MTIRRTFDKDFKLDAVKLVVEGKGSTRRISQDLGIGRSTLETWVRLYKEKQEDAFENPLASQEAEMRRLRRENEVLRQERDILKKTVGIFSQVRK